MPIGGDMRLEHIPLIIGAIVALIGLGFIADGLMADTGRPATERRRRMRAERSRPGEVIVGIGILCMAAALIGRDTWRYGTLSVLIGAGLVLIGIVLNRTFLKEALFFRGPARRADPSEVDSPYRARGPGAKPSSKGAGAARPAASPSQESAKPGRPAGSSQPASGVARPDASSPAAAKNASAQQTSPAPARSASPEQTPPATGKVERRKTPRGRK